MRRQRSGVGRAAGVIAAQAIAMIAALALVGCASGKVSAVKVTTAPVCDPNTGVCGVERLDLVTVSVSGVGRCQAAKINFGDGSFDLVGQNIDFDQQPWVVTHSFEDGWVGPKRIVAEGVTDCAGRASVLHHVFQQNSTREDHHIGLANPSPGIMCYRVPRVVPLPPLRTNTRVTVTSLTTPKINFGCPGGCTYDPDGAPGTSAPTGFTFPGFREFSLILVVGNQQVQGGTNVRFVTHERGELLLCLETNNLYSNMTGGWDIDIAVDESDAN
ncbi:MAG: hypothetical protein U1F33_01355 [Alphaproteobacteria bacterium]